MAGRREKLRRVGIIPEYRGFTPDGLASGDAIDMTVDEIGPSLRYATAAVNRVQSGRGYSGGSTYGDPAKPANQQQGWQNGSPAQNPGMPEGDPWAQPAPASPGATFGASNDFSSDSQDPEF